MQIYTLLKYMQSNPTREWLAKDFQKSPYFIGYEAGPRLCDLCDRGLAWRPGKDGRFQKFQLTEQGINFVIPSDHKVKKEMPESNTPLAELDTGTVLWQGDPTDILIMALCRKFDIMPSYKIF